MYPDDRRINHSIKLSLIGFVGIRRVESVGSFVSILSYCRYTKKANLILRKT